MDIHSHFDYDLLTRVTNIQPPVRGTKNRYPIGERRYAHKKYFLVEEMDGETVYVVCFGHRYVKRSVSQDEYTEMVKRNDKRKDQVHHTEVGYAIHEPHPHRLLIIRPDNTMEFCSTITYLGQGDIEVLSKWLPRHMFLFSDSRRGGVVIRKYVDGYKDDTAHPVYEGLRINIADLKPHASSQYKFYKARVNRKNALKVMKPYKELIDLGQTFIHAMGIDGIVDSMYELSKAYADFIKDDPDDVISTIHKRAKAMITEKVKDDPVWYILWTWIGGQHPFYYHIAYYGGAEAEQQKTRIKSMLSWYLRGGLDLAEDAKANTRKSVYSHENGALYFDELLEGKLPPAGDWGFKVEVGGKEVRRYY